MIFASALPSAVFRVVFSVLIFLLAGAAYAAAPTVTITSPADGSVFDFGTSIPLQASATDVEDDDAALTAAIEWVSDLDGVLLDTGGSISVSTLSVGSHVITAAVTDSEALQGSDSISITIDNTAPTANAQSVSTGEDTPKLITLTGSDPEDDPLTFTVQTGPSNGSLSGTAPNLTYTPNVDYNGPDSFTFTVNDGEFDSAEATVSITVTAGNDAPTANAQSVSTAEDTPKLITLTGSDPEDDPLTFTVQAGPSNGSLSGAAPNVTYTPDLNYNGPDSFTFTVNDGEFTSAAATVSITVTAGNDAPTANPQNVSTDEDTPVNIVLTGSDPEDDSLAFAIDTGPTEGTLSGTAPNVIYTPNADYNGPDSFTFTVNDGEFTSATATVSISVASISDAPTAVNDGPPDLPAIDEGGSINSTFNVLTNDTNPESVALTAVLVSPPTNSIAFTLNSNGTFFYRHDGGETITDSFTYKANNGALSNEATVTITINPVNDVPVFVGLVRALSTPEDTSRTIVLGDLIVSDPDNAVPGEITLTLLAGTNYSLAGDGTTITPAENFNGQLNVAATVSDLESTSARFTIVVDVDPVNDLPVLVAPIGNQNAVEREPFNLDISGNFADADGEALVYTASWSPQQPPNIDFNTRTGVFSGTPQEEDAFPPAGPIYQVIVTAQDPAGEIVSDSFELTIAALGRANLSLRIDVTSTTAMPNEDLRWTFTSNNPAGPVAGQNVELRGSFIGVGITVTAAAGTNCPITPVPAENRIDFFCTLGALPVGGSIAIVITTTTSQTTEIIVFATTAGAQEIPIDPNMDDNSDIEAAGVAEAFSIGAVQILGNSGIRSVAAGDVNNDGITDLVVGTVAGQPVLIYLGDTPRESCQCQRDFLPNPISIPDTGSNEGVALAHFDNNGSLDLVIANGGGQPDRIWRDVGAGSPTLMFTLPQTNANDVAVGDFDGDGNMDIAIAASSPNAVYFGDGNGGFPRTRILPGDADSRAVAVGRFDSNNRDDLVFANVGTNSQVFTKNSSGTGFSSRNLPNIGDAVAVAAADLNNDGRSDLVFGRVQTDPGDIPSNPVLINSGNGNFGTPSALLGISPTNDVLIGDVNEDGLPDLVFINASGVHQIWTNDGGTYVLHVEQIIDIGAVSGVMTQLGDTDNGEPGGVDLAMGGAAAAGVGVYLNDSAGNLGRGDPVPPVITLLGEASVTVATGTSYVDAGATAVDNIDGSLAPIATIGVNTAVVGNYTVTYNVTDFAGNAATPVVRSVTVEGATGRGGGGGGTFGFWTLIALVGVHLLILMRARVRPQWCRSRMNNNEKDH